MAESDEFVKARDTDTAAQRHNWAVFVQQLRARPVRAVILSTLFVAIAAGVLVLPHRQRHLPIVLAGIAGAAAILLLVVTLRRRNSP
jgi:1,4-dihydroxy-2-naphthoate octaprenyltransferase